MVDACYRTMWDSAEYCVLAGLNVVIVLLAFPIVNKLIWIAVLVNDCTAITSEYLA